MKISDSIYGSFLIEEPVLLDLINSDALQRLKGINTGGYYPAFLDVTLTEALSRYNHSLGVLLLLRKYNAPLEEQIAGLIHDVSHSAFSHTIDYIDKHNKENQKTQTSQDEYHEAFLQKTDIPKILKKHGVSLEYVLDDINFPLKENELPDICADRLDYSLRQLYDVFGIIDKAEKDYLLDNLIVYQNQFIFKNFKSARLFAERFWKMDDKYWSGFSSAVMFSLSGGLLRHAIGKNYITRKDLFRLWDLDIIGQIKKHYFSDDQVKYYFNLLNKPADYFENKNEDPLDHVFLKSRKVDPLFLSEGRLMRVSDIDADFKSKLTGLKKFKEYYVRIR